MTPARALVFRVHAAKRMLQRGIRALDVEAVVAHGDILENYPDDTPFPSRLLLSAPGTRPMHVVAADEPGTDITYIVTAYYPDPTQWDADLRRRRT